MQPALFLLITMALIQCNGVRNLVSFELMGSGEVLNDDGENANMDEKVLLEEKETGEEGGGEARRKLGEEEEGEGEGETGEEKENMELKREMNTTGYDCVKEGWEVYNPEAHTSQDKGGFPAMLDLAKQEDVLAIAYGHAWVDAGQVIVFTFDGAGHVWSWFAKPMYKGKPCLTRQEKPTKEKPDCVNVPTSRFSCSTCPSCKTCGFGYAYCCQDGKNDFALGSTVKLGDFGSGVLQQVEREGRKKYLLKNSEGLYLNPLFFLCKTGMSSAQPYFRWVTLDQIDF